jgi:hypothetical protein
MNTKDERGANPLCYLQATVEPQFLKYIMHMALDGITVISGNPLPERINPFLDLWIDVIHWH